jgi:hypothetical protein
LTLDTQKSVTNRGSKSVQLVHANQIFGATSTVGATQLAIDTSAAVALVLTGQLAVATDYLVIEKFAVEVQPA